MSLSICNYWQYIQKNSETSQNPYTCIIRRMKTKTSMLIKKEKHPNVTVTYEKWNIVLTLE